MLVATGYIEPEAFTSKQSLVAGVSNQSSTSSMTGNTIASAVDEKNKETEVKMNKEEEEEEENETDPDVLRLPTLSDVAIFLELSLPLTPRPSTVLGLKRAVVSCTDYLASTLPQNEKGSVFNNVARDKLAIG